MSSRKMKWKVQVKIECGLLESYVYCFYCTLPHLDHFIFITFVTLDLDNDLSGYKYNVPIKTVFDPLNGVDGNLQLPTSAGNG